MITRNFANLVSNHLVIVCAKAHNLSCEELTEIFRWLTLTIVGLETSRARFDWEIVIRPFVVLGVFAKLISESSVDTAFYRAVLAFERLQGIPDLAVSIASCLRI